MNAVTQSDRQPSFMPWSIGDPESRSGFYRDNGLIGHESRVHQGVGEGVFAATEEQPQAKLARMSWGFEGQYNNTRQQYVVQEPFLRWHPMGSDARFDSMVPQTYGSASHTPQWINQSFPHRPSTATSLNYPLFDAFPDDLNSPTLSYGHPINPLIPQPMPLESNQPTRSHVFPQPLPYHPSYPDVLDPFPVFAENEPLWLVRPEAIYNTHSTVVAKNQAKKPHGSIVPESFSTVGAIAPPPSPVLMDTDQRSQHSINQSGMETDNIAQNFADIDLDAGLFCHSVVPGSNPSNSMTIGDVLTSSLPHFPSDLADNLLNRSVLRSKLLKVIREMRREQGKQIPKKSAANDQPTATAVNRVEQNSESAEPSRKRKRPPPETKVIVISEDETYVDLRSQQSFAKMADCIHHFRWFRKTYRLTQSEICEAMSAKYSCYISQATVSRFEAGTLSPSNINALRLLIEAFMNQMQRIFPQSSDLPSNWQDAIASDSVDSAHFLPPGRPRRDRVILPALTKQLLEAHYTLSTHPTKEAMEKIAEQVKVDFECIRAWFCNKRRAEGNG